MTTENYPVCDVTGKTTYPTRRKARQAAMSLKQKNKHNENASHYWCEHCQGHHITSGKSKSNYKRRSKRFINTGRKKDVRKFKITNTEYHEDT